MKSYGDRDIELPENIETTRASMEWEKARTRAEKKVQKSGISGARLRTVERLNYAGDPEVLGTVHNILRSAWNATHPEDDQINIKHLF